MSIEVSRTISEDGLVIMRPDAKRQYGASVWVEFDELDDLIAALRREQRLAKRRKPKGPPA